MKHYLEYRHTLNVTMHFIDVMKMNPDYFANLDQQTKAAIEKQNRLYGDGEFNILAAVARMYGMAPDTGRLDGKDDPDTAGFFQQSKNSFKQANIREKVNPMLDKYSANIRKDFELMSKPGGEGMQAARRHYTNKAVRSQFPLAETRWESMKSGGGEQPEAEKAYNAFKSAQNDYNEMLIQRDALMAA